MKIHILRIAPKLFEGALHGKRFVVCNDRGFEEGDHIILDEWDGTHYTGRQIGGNIDYVITYEDFPDVIEEGYCVFVYRIKPNGVQYFGGREKNEDND